MERNVLLAVNTILHRIVRSSNNWCNPTSGVFFHFLYEINSAIFERNKKRETEISSTVFFSPHILFYYGTVHCAKTAFRNLREDMKILNPRPIKTSLETLISPQPAVKNKYRGESERGLRGCISSRLYGPDARSAMHSQG